MRREEVLRRILREKIIAVVRLRSAEKMNDVVAALHAGAIGIVEITMTMPDALGWIRSFAGREDLCIGAGTVMNAPAARAAVDAGAQFLVSPIFFDELISLARAADVCAVPSGFTPSEIYRAWTAGADAVKIFPLAGIGPAYLRAIKGPMPDIPLIPTNGVTLENAAEFFRAGAAALGAGTPLVNQQLVNEKNFGEIVRRAALLTGIARELNGSGA